MKEKEVFEQFLRVSEIPEEDVVDYRFCTKFYAGIYITNAIIIQLKKDKYDNNIIIYTAYDIDNILNELKQSMECKTQFEQGFHHALDEIRNFGKAVEHISVN